MDGSSAATSPIPHRITGASIWVELENVLIGMVKPHLGGDDTYLTETLNLKYSKIKWRYTQQKVGGGTAGNTAGGWDLAANKVAA